MLFEFLLMIKKLEGLTLSTPDHFIIVTEASFDILKSQAQAI